MREVDQGKLALPRHSSYNSSDVFRSLDAGPVVGVCRWAGALGEFQLSIVPRDRIAYIKLLAFWLLGSNTFTSS